MIGKNLCRWVRILAGAGCAVLLSSCFESEQGFVLNPDGSGKVKHECTFQNVSLMDDDDADPEEVLQGAVAKVLSESEGVDAWKDVSFKRLDDGRMWFQGTAYFKDLSKLDISNQSMLKFAWKQTGAGKGELVLAMEEDEAGQAKKPVSAEKLKEERSKFEQAKPMLAAVLGGMKQKVSFKLPGKVTGSSNLTKEAGGRLGLEFEGKKMIEAMEKLLADDEWLAEQGFDSEKPPAFDERTCELLFGEKALVKAAVSGATKPVFDYAAEVAVAKKEMAALQEKLGVAAVAPASEAAPLKNLEVVGMRLAKKVPKRLEVRPFNEGEGLTLSLLAELPGSILDFTDECAVETAVASDGASLLKGDKDWDRRISFPRLSKDKAQVIFEVGLKQPAAGVKVLKELTGRLQYRVGTGTKEVDLGLTSLADGAKGTEFGAVIKSVETSDPDDGSQKIEMKLRLEPDGLVAIWVVEDGEKTELERRGYSSSGGLTAFTFESEAALPEGGSIVVEVHDGLQVFDAPFKLENVGLPVFP